MNDSPETSDDRAADPTAGPAAPEAPARAEAGGADAPAPPLAPPATGSWLPTLLVAGCGLAVSFDLLVRTLALMQEHAPGGIDVCRAVFRVGCDEALQSSQSWRFGVPAAGWGMAYFGALAWLAFLARAIGGWFARRAAAAALLLCLPGLVVSVVLATAILTGRAPMCPLCLVVHAINLVLAVLVWRVGRFGSGGFRGMLRDALRWAVGPPGAEPPEARWTVVGVASAALVGLVVFQWGVIQIERRGGAEAAFDAAKVFREYDAVARVEFPASPDDARFGPAEASAQLVVFSDFECPGCAALAPDIAEIAARHPGRVSVVFKHYPLSPLCNPSVPDDRHPGACEIAAASEAARRQGRFWHFHDLAFENADGGGDDVLRRMAEEAGLDVERFERDRSDPSAMDRVRADVALAERLHVDGTPTVFLNGRKVPHLSRKALEALVERAVRRAG